MTPKRKGKKLRNEEDLSLEGKNNSHDRRQKMLNSFNQVVCILIVVIPLVAVAGLVILLGHYALIGDWTKFNDLGSSSLKYVIASAIGYVAKNISPTDN